MLDETPIDEELLAAADNSLYQAKKSGRDRIIVERRRWLRLKPASGFKVEVTSCSGDKQIKVFDVENISKKGILMLFPKDLPYEEFLCRLYFPKENVHAEIRCKLIHKDKSKEEFYKVGIYFVDIPKYIQEKIPHHGSTC